MLSATKHLKDSSLSFRMTMAVPMAPPRSAPLGRGVFLLQKKSTQPL